MLDAHKQINPHYSILAAAHISHLRIKKKKHMDPKTNTAIKYILDQNL